MKQWYLFLFMCSALVLLNASSAYSQNWRPFRPNGDVHAFRGATADTVLTLRLDSAGTQGADSVYYFNRIMRRAGNAYQWRKSRNNQFGMRLIYQPAQHAYILDWDPAPGPVPDGRSLQLRPFAAVGQSWSSFSIDVGVTTTLVARGVAQVDGVQDSVVTFRVGQGSNAQTVVLSKSFGLVSAPADLRLAQANAKIFTLARRPAPAGQSYYDPLTLLDLRPGDELGYAYQQFSSSPIGCASGQLLRRVMSRQVRSDSVVYEFQEQGRFVYSGAPGCLPAGTAVTPVLRVHAAASLRTGQWQGPNRQLPLYSFLLAYEYRPLRNGTTGVMMGHPVVGNRTGAACGGAALLQQEVLYRRVGADYSPGLDALNEFQLSAQSVGVVRELEYELTYFRRTPATGTVQTCGNRTNFATLLPTRAAQHAALLKLHPNPAAETAIFTLPTPARAGTRVLLLDELGRTIRTQDVAAGQTDVPLNLRGLAAGVYVAEVQAADETPLRARVQHIE